MDGRNRIPGVINDKRFAHVIWQLDCSPITTQYGLNAGPCP